MEQLIERLKSNPVLAGVFVAFALLIVLFSAYFTFFKGGEGGGGTEGGSEFYTEEEQQQLQGTAGGTTGPTTASPYPGGPYPGGPYPGAPGSPYPGGPYPGAPPGASYYPGAPYPGAPTDTTGLAMAPTTTKPPKPLPPKEPSRSDPFAPLIKPRPQSVALAEALMAELPPISIARLKPPRGRREESVPSPMVATAPELEASQRRMVGLISGRRAAAIIEVNGEMAVVQPGDVLPDFTRVDRIERDRLVLRSIQTGQSITVPLQSSAQATTTTGGVGPGIPPGVTPGPGYPGRPPYYGPYGPYGPYQPGGVPRGG